MSICAKFDKSVAVNLKSTSVFFWFLHHLVFDLETIGVG